MMTIKLLVSRVSTTTDTTATGTKVVETVRLEPVKVKDAPVALTPSSILALRITDAEQMGKFTQGQEVEISLTPVTPVAS